MGLQYLEVPKQLYKSVRQGGLVAVYIWRYCGKIIRDKTKL